MDNPYQPPPYFPTSPPPPAGKCEGNACLSGIEQASTAAQQAAQQGLDKLNKLIERLQPLLQVLDTSLLVIINEKLGPQIPGGISSKLLAMEKVLNSVRTVASQIFRKLNLVAQWLHLDRALNLLTFATTVHNAAMLSRSLGETLLQVISNVLAAIGIKDDEGSPLDIGSIVGNTVENIVKGAIGTENYTALSAGWKKANRIYQASANILSNLNNIRYSVTSALETIGGWNAKIGNALKRYGVLGDKAYPWMNPSPNFDNKFMRGLETVENAVSQIDAVASEVLSAQESVTEIIRQKGELEEAIKSGTEKPGVDNDQQKAKDDAAKAASQSPDINPIDTVKPGGV
jgi:hypothetical protein